MDAIASFFAGLSVWHWLGLGIILLTLEVAIGTFDLLWVSVGAFLTALFAWIIPPPAGGWEGQLTFFGFAAIALVIGGRTLFAGLRNAPTTHPTLNDRLASMVGQKGEAATTFEVGRGKVKVGDTVWLAQGDGAIAEGDLITVVGAESGVLKVRGG
jgi:membrane protein implicated in regulation of membrane protease activity